MAGKLSSILFTIASISPTLEQTMESCAAWDRTDASLKACKSCNLVKFCNVNCQRAHWSKHKQACKKRAAELFHQKLYAEPPPFACYCYCCHWLLPLTLRVQCKRRSVDPVWVYKHWLALSLSGIQCWCLVAKCNFKLKSHFDERKQEYNCTTTRSFDCLVHTKFE